MTNCSLRHFQGLPLGKAVLLRPNVALTPLSTQSSASVNKNIVKTYMIQTDLLLTTIRPCKPLVFMKYRPPVWSKFFYTKKRLMPYLRLIVAESFVRRTSNELVWPGMEVCDRLQTSVFFLVRDNDLPSHFYNHDLAPIGAMKCDW